MTNQLALAAAIAVVILLAVFVGRWVDGGGEE